MKNLNQILEIWEPTIIFLGFGLEIILSLLVLGILILEYFYDKKVEEKKTKRKITKKRVKVVIDEEGNAIIEEAPKHLDISIEHKGK